jgi:hypothetical protein
MLTPKSFHNPYKERSDFSPSSALGLRLGR